jgi:nucleotide-binding universal stress UspA family protein
MMYKRILAVVGNDPQIDPSVEYAIALAASTDAELCLLGVLRLPLTTCAPDMVAGSVLALESVLQVQEYAIACAAEAATQAGVATTTTVRWGAFPDAIMHAATEADCDVIVVGSPACPGWHRRLGGYLASKVLAQAQRPVLVITEPPPTVYGTPLWSRVLVVHDGSPDSDATLEYALTLAQTSDLDLCVLCFDAGWPAASAPTLRDRARAAASLAMAATRTAMAGIQCDVMSAPGRGVRAILDAADEYACDAIVLGASQRTGWSRFWRRPLAKPLVTVTALPVLYVDQCTTWHYATRTMLSSGEEV